MSAKHLAILQQVVNLPTAPFVETQVIDYIRRFVAARPALAMSSDRFGNLLVKYRPPGKARKVERPLLFAAHMDHPGFVVTKTLDGNRVEASFRGWVQASYFAGERIQFYSDGRWVPAKIEKVIARKPLSKKEQKAAASARSFRDQEPPEAVIAMCASTVAPGSPGMWNFPDAVIRNHEIRARACDDLAGLAAVLCMLDEICRRRISVPTLAFFTRAEEVGFGGALAAVRAKTVPRNAVIVAVECSKAVTGVALGAGPVLRVGDKASVFTPAATAYCQVVAERLAERDKSFIFQRKLMDGGTCESTAYCHYGYDATGICLPLGNYHNMDATRGKVGPEFVDVRDYSNLVKWFVALAQSPTTLRFDGRHPGLDKRLETLRKQHQPHLLNTAQAVMLKSAK